MNEIKNIVVIIALTLLFSCNGKSSDEPGRRDDTARSTTTTTSTTSSEPNIGGGIIDRFPDCSPNGRRGTVRLVLHAQERDFWCWAASAQMVMEALGLRVTQCDEANKQKFTRENCCPPTPVACDDAGWPQFEQYGFATDTTINAPLTWEQLQKQIDCGRKPFCATWHWNNGGGHMMVVNAYKIQDGDSLVQMFDPWPPGSYQWKTYAEYATGPDYTHWNDFYNVRKQERPAHD